MKKVHITSLGCSKNLVDASVLSGQLQHRRYQVTAQPEDADLIIVNTCGFINDAKSESIQAIFEALKLKENDKKKKIFVTGCLSQRYKDDLAGEIPEIDAIFGTEDYDRILDTLGEEKFHAEDMYMMRDLESPGHFAYLKISEGCNHTCSFCVIPLIRGKHRSRSLEAIIAEARMLAARGVKELILVSQDTSYYGKDLYGKFRIIELLNRLAEEKLFNWIRTLYWYPTNFPLEFIDLMNTHESIIPYLDMPIQHASDNVLALMRRAEREEILLALYEKIRSKREDITLRTTLIIGHPGEHPEDFKRLRAFIEKIRFDRVGTFIYSDEEGTRSFLLEDKIPTVTARRRQAQLMTVQRAISEEKNKGLRGTIQTVLIDSYDADHQYYTGRTFRDAPEIDNEVLISAPKSDPRLIGTFQPVCIDDASEYELYGSFDVNRVEFSG